MKSNGVLRQPKGPPFNPEAEQNGRNSPTNWSGNRRRFSSEGGDFYGADGPDFSYSEYSDESNNNNRGAPFVPQKESVFITHVESPTTFWAQSADSTTAEGIEKLSSDLQVYCQNKPVLQNPPFLKKIYGGIYSEDSQWYRCIVVEQAQGEKVKVRFIDFGNTEEITRREMVCLSMSLINHKPYAQRYGLDGLQDLDSKSPQFLKGVDYMNSMTCGKVLCVTTKKHRTSMLEAVPVDLVDHKGNLNINSEILNKGYTTSAAASGGRASPPQLPKEPISPLVRPETSSGSSHSTPLMSTPMPQKRDSPELQQLKDTVRNQQNQINSQRHLNFQLKEAHKKDMTELQQKVSELKEKEKQEQDHVLSCKFKKLIAKANELRKLRHASESEEESSAIFTAVKLLKTLNEMTDLTKVKSSEQKLEGKQNEIRTCSEKPLLSPLVEERNAVRTELLEDIKQFCEHMSDAQLEEWKTNLEASQVDLRQCAEAVSSSAAPTTQEGVPYTELISEYEEWIEISKLDKREVRIRCDQQKNKFKRVFASVVESVEFEGAEETRLTEDLDAVLREFESVANEEISISKRTEQAEAKELKAKVLAVLLSEINKEIDAEQLRYYLNHFRALKVPIGLLLSGLATMKPNKVRSDRTEQRFQNHIEDSIVSKPNIDEVLATRKAIRSLKSKIGHKLIDRDDLRERDDADDEEIKECEEELSKAYSELHSAFLQEQKLVRHLAVLSCVHFPELPLQYPELAIKEWLATNGLVISGRSLDHYPHDNKALDVHSACHIIDTEFAGKKCLVKEYVLRDATSRDLFQKEAVNFHNVQSSRLIQLQALFYDKKNISPFLQVPNYQTLPVWLTATPSVKEVTMVIKGILEGLKALHGAGLVHGEITENALLVDQEDGINGYLDHYDFSQTADERATMTANKFGMDLNKCEPSPAFDMLCYGTAVAKILFPDLTSMEDFSLHTEDKDLIALIEGLTTADISKRLTAKGALEMAYFKMEEQLD